MTEKKDLIKFKRNKEVSKKENLLNLGMTIFTIVTGLLTAFVITHLVWFNLYVCEPPTFFYHYSLCVKDIGDFNKWLISLIPAIFDGCVIVIIWMRIKLLRRTWI